MTFSTKTAASQGSTLTPPDQTLTGEEMVARAEALIPLLRERAARADETRSVEADTFRRMQEAGLFHVFRPKRYGGLELSEYHHAIIAMTLAKGCASTAWVFSILNGHSRSLLAYSEEVQDELWAENSFATCAGNITVNPKATAERVDGGYLLTGDWGFCSGSDFSEWLFFTAAAGPDGDGHRFLLPRSEARLIDDWHPTGMRGTGSRRYAVERVFVPDRRVVRTKDMANLAEENRRLHPSFDSMVASTPDGHFPYASVALGAALGAIEHFARTVPNSTRVRDFSGVASSLADQDYVATEFASAVSTAEAAASVLVARSRAAEDRGRRRVRASAAERSAERLANAHVARSAVEAVQRIYFLIGTRANHPSHPVSLAKRDIEVIATHQTVNWRESSVGYLSSIVDTFVAAQKAEASALAPE
ncbi:acyl-CoA dehydrogenase family protein [Glaciibacter sp. 2TAF33]|uniref:acyl-CoA dehydrogenase family protein n=1 Tax=Glaciibacter sp. 2TAF33 TaxID=3233015 RepID=UPI003F92FB4F